MKVVLFCGGRGTRLGAGTDRPKPLTPVGTRPILWHIMRYYAHFGHTEFVVCLGFGGEAVKSYFRTQPGARSFVVRDSDGDVDEELSTTVVGDWSITFADTGLDTPIGERLRRVRPLLGDDDMFLATYGDCLTDAPMDLLVDRVRESDAVGSLLAVHPSESFHVLTAGMGGRLAAIQPAAEAGVRINGGYFVLRPSIFDYLGPGTDLVMDGCAQAAREGRFTSAEHDGFWAPLDTYKEWLTLEAMHQAAIRPWAVWESAERPPLRLVVDEEDVQVLSA